MSVFPSFYIRGKQQIVKRASPLPYRTMLNITADQSHMNRRTFANLRGGRIGSQALSLHVPGMHTNKRNCVQVNELALSDFKEIHELRWGFFRDAALVRVMETNREATVGKLADAITAGMAYRER